MLCSNKGTLKNWQHHYKINRFFSSALLTTLFLIFAVNTHGATLVVPAGGSLQNAVNAAQPGDVIVLTSWGYLCADNLTKQRQLSGDHDSQFSQ